MVMTIATIPNIASNDSIRFSTYFHLPKRQTNQFTNEKFISLSSVEFPSILTPQKAADETQHDDKLMMTIMMMTFYTNVCIN